MAKSVGHHPRILVDDHDITRHVAEANITIRPNHVRTVTLELFDPKIETDPESGALTITVND